MAGSRLTGLLRRLQTGLVPAIPAGQADRDALRAFIAYKDESAFAALVQRHGPMVLRVCQRVLHHMQDAEDAFQATFLVLARKADAIDKSTALASWLHGVALRTALRAKRDAGRRRAREQQTPIPVRLDPAEDLAWRDVQVLLEHEIQRLPERYRSAFVLCYLEGRSRADAAVELGVEENTLSSRLARARERLKRRLARRGITLAAVLAAVALTTGAMGMAIPPAMIDSTARAALLFAARQTVPGISSFALQLSNGTIQTMAIAKMKWAVGLLALGGTLVIGTWGAGQGQGPPRGSRASSPPGGESREEKPAAVERTADYAQRQRSLKNLKLIAMAMQNYVDTTGHFPGDVVDKAGKPLLSWRVELLPYLDQDELYRQFKRNEPWESEHNLQLLAKMPEVLRVGFEAKGATHTYYQRFTIPSVVGGFDPEGASAVGGPASAPMPGGFPGAGGAAPPMPGGFPGGVGAAPPGSPSLPGGGAPGFPGDPSAPSMPGMPAAMTAPRLPFRVTEVTDGLSYTLGVIEAGPPVPWSKPADFAYDPHKPLPPLTGPFANVRNATTLDGTVHGLRPDLDETTLRRLIDPSDGKIVAAAKTLRARFAADTQEEKKALARLIEENETLIAAIEKQAAENAALLALTNKLTRDMDKAEETQEWLRRMLDNLKVVNKKLRAEIGLAPNQSLPKDLLKGARP